MIGAVLAGGAGRRLGCTGGKATAPLAGRPLVTYPLATLSEACDSVAVVCKPDTRLPELPGVERWDEPVEPRHPLTGIVHSVERAGGAVLFCAVDMPLVTAATCRSVRDAASAGDSAAVVATADGVLQPLLGVYR